MARKLNKEGCAALIICVPLFIVIFTMTPDVLMAKSQQNTLTGILISLIISLSSGALVALTAIQIVKLFKIK